MDHQDADFLDQQEIETVFSKLRTFVETEAFQNLLVEMRNTPRALRPIFVEDVIINDHELGKRGIKVPEAFTVQRSSFADGRPTLFCVSCYLADNRRKVTITYDDSPLEMEGG